MTKREKITKILSLANIDQTAQAAVFTLGGTITGAEQKFMDELEVIMIETFDEIWSDKEVDKMLEFYQDPTIQSAIQKAPEGTQLAIGRMLVLLEIHQKQPPHVSGEC